MSSKEQSVTLLRINKRAQVEALRSLGFTDVSDDTKASEFAKRIKWAGGLLDITIACVRKADMRKFYFTKDDWDSLTRENKQKFIFRGVRVRAFARSFIIAAQDCLTASLGATFTWGASGIITDLNPKLRGAAYDDFASSENTSLIIATLGGTSAGCPAATACRNYKAFSQGDDGVSEDDDTLWSLPSLGIMRIMYVLREEINAFFTEMYGRDSNLQNTAYWSSTYYDTTNRWYQHIGTGQIYFATTTTAYRVRPISEE